MKILIIYASQIHIRSKYLIIEAQLLQKCAIHGEKDVSQVGWIGK